MAEMRTVENDEVLRAIAEDHDKVEATLMEAYGKGELTLAAYNAAIAENDKYTREAKQDHFVALSYDML